MLLSFHSYLYPISKVKTRCKFFSGLLTALKLNLFYSKKADGQIFRIVEEQKSDREFSPGLNLKPPNSKSVPAFPMQPSILILLQNVSWSYVIKVDLADVIDMSAAELQRTKEHGSQCWQCT